MRDSTLPSKVEAIQHAPQPQNVQQLRSFLGLLNYYGKFISNLADIIHPLNQLLHKDTKWSWNQACFQAFTAAKEALKSSQVLTHYDPSLPITLAGDASAYGIGSVILHILPDGSERPIAFGYNDGLYCYPLLSMIYNSNQQKLIPPSHS